MALNVQGSKSIAIIIIVINIINIINIISIINIIVIFNQLEESRGRVEEKRAAVAVVAAEQVFFRHPDCDDNYHDDGDNYPDDVDNYHDDVDNYPDCDDNYHDDVDNYHDRCRCC